MARLGIAPRSPRALWLSHDARNDCAIERASYRCRSRLIEPIHCRENAPELWIIDRKRGQPFTERFAFPPRLFSKGCESVTVESRSDIMRRRARELTVGDQR